MCSHLSPSVLIGAKMGKTLPRLSSVHEHQESIRNATDSTQLFICHHKPHDTCATCELQAGRRGGWNIPSFWARCRCVLVIVATCGRGYKQSTCDWRSSSHHHAAYFCVPWLKICQPTGPLDKVSCRMILYFPISDTIYEAILLQPSYSPAHS